MRKTSTFLMGIVAVTSFAISDARADDLTGKQIVKEATDRALPDTSKIEMKMTLFDKRGRTRERQIVTWAKDYPEGTRSLLRFIQPPDVAGTGFLSYEKEDAEDEQYLYLPAKRQVLRIEADRKNQSFMGSDLTYGDLQTRDVNKDTHTKLGEETLEGHKVWVIESKPTQSTKGKDVSYSRTKQWIRKDNYVPIKVEFYDKRTDKLLKVMVIEKLEKQGKYWVPRITDIKNLKTRTRTRLEILKQENDIPMDDSTFTKRNLEKG